MTVQPDVNLITTAGLVVYWVGLERDARNHRPDMNDFDQGLSHRTQVTFGILNFSATGIAILTWMRPYHDRKHGCESHLPPQVSKCFQTERHEGEQQLYAFQGNFVALQEPCLAASVYMEQTFSMQAEFALHMCRYDSCSLPPCIGSLLCNGEVHEHPR